MAQVEVIAQERTEVGGNSPRRLRRAGLVPAIIYGVKKGSTPLSIDLVRLEKKVGQIHENQIMKVKMSGGDKERLRPRIIKEIQFNHLTGDVLHVDFQEIVMDEKLVATVPVAEVGEAIGVTRDGGVLEQVLHEIEIECLPADIPENIKVDVSDLEIGKSIMVEDIDLGDKIKILTEPELSVFTVAAPMTEEELEELEAAAAGPAEAAPTVIGEEEEEIVEEEEAPPEPEPEEEEKKEEETEK